MVLKGEISTTVHWSLSVEETEIIHLYEIPEKPILTYNDKTVRFGGYLRLGLLVGQRLWRVMKAHFKMMDIFCILTVIAVTWVYVFVKPHQTLHSNRLHLIFYNYTTIKLILISKTNHYLWWILCFPSFQDSTQRYIGCLYYIPVSSPSLFLSFSFTVLYSDNFFKSLICHKLFSKYNLLLCICHWVFILTICLLQEVQFSSSSSLLFHIFIVSCSLLIFFKFVMLFF